MNKMRFVYYEEDGYDFGFLEEYSDYRSQAKTIEKLKSNLAEIYNELTSGESPFAGCEFRGREVAVFVVGVGFVVLPIGVVVGVG